MCYRPGLDGGEAYDSGNDPLDAHGRREDSTTASAGTPASAGGRVSTTEMTWERETELPQSSIADHVRLIRQKGVLAFRVLQSPWKLVLDIEQVDPWIQVTSLQHATVNEAQVKVAFVSGGRARAIPKALRIAMRTDQDKIDTQA